MLLSTRVSSGAKKLFEERAELTVVAQYQGPDRAEANQPLLGWTRPGAGGGTAIRAVKINSLVHLAFWSESISLTFLRLGMRFLVYNNST